jgi:SAM-dependent methyltransferase
MPTDEELTNIYSREYYKAWGVEESEAHAATRDMKMATFNRNLDIIQRSVAGGAVLDLGCATGFFLEAARERGFVPYGVEFSPFAAEVAREKFGAQNIFEGTVENSPFPPHSFDVITMSDFIEHVRDPVAVLRKARELLKPGGVILITTPDYHTFSRILMGEKWTHYKEEHLYYFDPISLRYAAQKAGLSIMRYARAQKALNLLYAYSQFNTYQHWLFTPLAKILCAITPSAIMKKNFYVSMGELSATLQ